jgi:PKD repeat protein
MAGIVNADTTLQYAGHDGTLLYQNAVQNFSTLVTASSATTTTDNGNSGTVKIISSATPNTDKYGYNYRTFFSFNTSYLSGKTITSAKIGTAAYVNGASNLGAISYTYTLANPANVSDYVNADYGTVSATHLTDDFTRAQYESVSRHWNSSLNANGVSSINTTGWTTFSLRSVADVDNNVALLTWASAVNSGLVPTLVSYTGATYDPFLVVVWTASGATPPVASFTLNKNFLRIPNSVTATDTSTNTPTSWQWSWGDGTANSTTQNPSHQYLKRGKWDIILTATNAGGSSTTSASSVRVYGYEN